MTEREWLRVRGHLTRNRFALAVTAAAEYPRERWVAGTPLLAAPGWLPSAPLDADAVELHLDATGAGRGPTGGVEALEPVRPVRADGRRYPTYSAAVAALAAPAMLRDLPTYRLLDADLTGDRPRLGFGLGRYFDGLDVGEAAGHDYAAADLGRPGAGTVRAALGEPWNLATRSTNLAISTLTLRVDRAAGTASFPLHWRDPARVGHAGGLYQVVPVGVFQPSDPAPWNVRPDFDLWRCTVREFAEELLGRSEAYGSDRAPLDYGGWPFAAALTRARAAGHVRFLILGLGTDPLTFATDLLAVAVIDAPIFDALFDPARTVNDEGRVIWSLAGTNAGGPTPDAGGPGIPFTEATITRLVRDEPMQAAGAALLALAWRHRAALLA